MSLVIDVANVTLRRGHSLLLNHLSWSVNDNERWVVIGPNGAGKTTLMQIIAARIFPTTGKVTLLGERLGSVDVFEVRPRIGFCSAALDDQIPVDEKVRDVVISAAYAVFGRWRESYSDVDYDRAEQLMEYLRVNQMADRVFATLSAGEKQRVQIARALMADPELLVLDEPAAGLDLAGRELLLATLSELALNPASPTFVMVTHHVEEIPQGITHAMLIKHGGVVKMGPLAEVMTSNALSLTFDLPLRLDAVDGRWYAQARWGD